MKCGAWIFIDARIDGGAFPLVAVFVGGKRKGSYHSAVEVCGIFNMAMHAFYVLSLRYLVISFSNIL